MSKLLRTIGAKGFKPFELSNAARYATGSAHMMAQPACYINGAWVTSTRTDKQIEVEDPCTNRIIGTVPLLGSAETTAAIEAASTAFETWRNVLPKERAAAVRRWGALMTDNIEGLSSLLCREGGKVHREGKGEVLYAASFGDWYAAEGERLYGDVIPTPRHGVQATVYREPVGVVGLITPWNFPAAMITRAACAAIAAGCTVVVKPAESTPFTALALAQLAEEAGIPAGVFNVVTGDPASIGSTLVDAFAVRKISFTGSTRVGKLLYKGSAATMKKLGLELGGNAPYLVFEDADLPRAAGDLVTGKFRNAGQTCICVNRVLVQAGVYDAFVQLVTERVRALKVGNNFDPSVAVGAMIGKPALERMAQVVQDAVEKGAKLEVGGKIIPGPGNFFEPTVLSNVPHGIATCCQGELFGPVLPMIRFETEEEGVRMANNTHAGLAAYFATTDYRRQYRVARELRYGMVGCNESTISGASIPFGGIKDSGLGRDGSKYGIEAFTNLKYVLYSTV